MLTKNHATLDAEVKAHVAADAVVAGGYWNEADNDVGGVGCFIGCLAHGEDANVLGDRFGLPLPLVKIAEGIFESLPEKEGIAFFAAIPDAVGRDGKDLSLVHWKFLASELRALPAMPSHIQDVIDPVIAGMDLLGNGEVWSGDDAAYAARAAADAAYAAARAADFADDAIYAARAAAYAAAYAAARAADFADDAIYAARAAAYAAADVAARAAYAADFADDTRRRQRDTLLKLISEA